MDNSENLVALGAQDTGRRQTTKTKKNHNTTQKTNTTRKSKMLDTTIRKHTQNHNKT